TIDGLGYYVGFIRYRKKDYRGALEAFRRGRTTDPQLQQLTKFYTGLSLAVLGLPAQASAEVEQALKLAPGSPLTGPAERLGDSFESSFGYSFFGTYYNDLTSFNITDHMVNASFAYRTVLFNMPAQFALSYAWDMLYLREAAFLSRNTATLSGVLVEKEPGISDTLEDAVRTMGHLTQSFFRFQNKEFFESNPRPIDDEFRDANNYTMGILHLLRFAGD